MMGLGRLLVDATSFISFTGFPQSYNVIPQKIYLRGLFAGCTLVGLCGLIVQTVIIFRQFYLYEIDTVIQLDFRRIPYPAVTVCNLNGFKKSAITKSPQLTQLMAAYSFITYQQSKNRHNKRRKREVREGVVKDDERENLNCTEVSQKSRVDEENVVESTYLSCGATVQACISACTRMMCLIQWNRSSDCDLAKTVSYTDSVFHSCIYDHICSEECSLCSQYMNDCALRLTECSDSHNHGLANSCVHVIDSMCSWVEQYCGSLNSTTPKITPLPPSLPPVIPPAEIGKTLDKLKEANYTQYQQIVEQYETAVIESLPPIFKKIVIFSLAWNLSKSEEEDVITSDEVAIKVMERMQEISASLTIASRRERQQMGHTFDETIISCSINTQSCLPSDWTDISDPDYTNCFTFNFNQSHSRFASRPGSFYGLRIIILSNTSEYLFTSQQSGAKISIHPNARDPFPSVEGFNVGLGSYNAFSVRYREISRLTEPYGDCVSYKDPSSYFYEKDYHNEGCLRSCFQRQVYAKCGCADSRYHLGAYTTICKSINVNQSRCLSKFADEFSTVHILTCSCRTPCREGNYVITKTSTKWPQNSNFKARTCADSLLAYYKKSCRQIYEENAVFVDVFYDKLNFETIQERPVFSTTQLFNNIVGSAGLFLSFTVPGFVELIIIVIQAIGYIFNLGQLADVPSGNPNYEESEFVDESFDNNVDFESDSEITELTIERVPSSESLRPYLQDSVAPVAPVHEFSPSLIYHPHIPCTPESIGTQSIPSLFSEDHKDLMSAVKLTKKTKGSTRCSSRIMDEQELEDYLSLWNSENDSIEFNDDNEHSLFVQETITNSTRSRPRRKQSQTLNDVAKLRRMS